MARFRGWALIFALRVALDAVTSQQWGSAGRFAKNGLVIVAGDSLPENVDAWSAEQPSCRCWLLNLPTKLMFHANPVQSVCALIALLGALCAGCGTTREHQATEQLVVSDAVDRSIQNMDFRPLTGQKVYLDSSYLRHVKGLGFVNSEYVISALRQQILGAGCLMQDSAQDADIVIEARIGALGADNHLVTYGIPENNALRSAATIIPNAPTIPTLPEIALARREAREATAKIAAFAYDRETRKPIWQSGVKHSVATAKDTWVLGVGPFQGGSIREKTKLAGSTIQFGQRSPSSSPAGAFDRPPVDYTAETRFNQGWPVLGSAGHAPALLASSPDDATEEASDETTRPSYAEDEPAEKVAEAPTKSTIK